ncbi:MULTISPECIES: YfcE family phosphodiesterase [Campylobacter]|uniref:YfcE family phosphodiesterase n=1 Tax=Campylobacter TaxID=194 RepID=UPI0014705189|nr:MULTISPECIES: YfcE family phosphodiesterase [Campylobacter]MBN7288918.1 YfcE family phosphodiesterase [Campylobacter curvus]MDU6827203.1 YfcE family phosphodiesterase [Campylobacter sp.]
MSVLKLGLISDSHFKPDVAREAIEILKREGVQMLLHAGDIVELDTLLALRESGLAYRAVLGNNDDELAKFKGEFELFDEPYEFKIMDMKIALMHHPKFLNIDADIVVFGHTHSFGAIIKDGRLFINPGEICGRKFGKFSFMLLAYENQEFIAARFSRSPNESRWHKETIKIESA